MNTFYDYSEKTLAAMAVLIAAFVCLATLVNISFGNDHANIIRAFDNDEYYGVMIMNRNLNNNVIDPQPHYMHGRVYQALTFGVLKTLMSLGYSLSDRLVITVFRVLSFSSFVLLLCAIYIIMRRLGVNLLPAVLAVLFVASIPEVNHYAQIFHPDMLQTLLIVLAFAVAVWEHTFRNAFLAAGLYGLAIATKLGTPLLFPFLLVPAALKHLAMTETPPKWSRVASFLAVRYVIAFAILVLCFLIAYPHALTVSFANDLALMSKIVGSGIWIGGQTVVAVSSNPLLWLPILVDEFSVFGLLLILTGTTAGVWALFRTPSPAGSLRQPVQKRLADENSRSRITAALYGVCTLLLMVLLVRTRNSRYLFPVYPFLAIVCFAGIDDLVRLSGKRWAGILVSLVIFGLTASHALATVQGLSSMANKYHSPRVTASRWIMQNYGTDVTVVADSSTYVPPEMPHFQMYEHQVARGLTWIENNPDIRLIIVTKGGSATWAWPKKGTRLAEGLIETHPEFGAEDADRFAAFLRAVGRGQSAWKLVLEKEDMMVMENTKARR